MYLVYMYIHPMVLFLERTLTKTGSAYLGAAGLVTSLFQSQCSGASGYWLLTQVGRGQGSNRGLFAGIQEKNLILWLLIQNLPLIISVMLILVVHTYNPSLQEAMTEILQVQSQPGPQSEILSQNNNSSNNSTFLW